MRLSRLAHSARISTTSVRMRAASDTLGICQERGQRDLELAAALGEHAPALERNRAQLVDQRRAHADQARPHAVQRLQVELVLRLQVDEAHRRAGRRLRDALGVAVVVLLRLDVRPHIFGRHQPNRVSLPRQQPAEMVRAAARLHRDHAMRQPGRDTRDRLAPHPASKHDRPFASRPTRLQLVLPRSIPSTRSASSSSVLSSDPTPDCAGGEGRAIP